MRCEMELEFEKISETLYRAFNHTSQGTIAEYIIELDGKYYVTVNYNFTHGKNISLTPRGVDTFDDAFEIANTDAGMLI